MTNRTTTARRARRELSAPEERFGARLRTNVSAEALQSRIMEREAASLAATFEHVRITGTVPLASGLILSGRRRYIAGAGKSAAYAALLGADLAAALSNVFVIDGHALDQLDVLSDVRSTDVLIVFSFRRYRASTVDLGRAFHRGGGRLVVVTDAEAAPLAPLADALIAVDTGSASYADSPTSVAAVCHLLSTLTAASAKGARRRLKNRTGITHELGLYVDAQAETTNVDGRLRRDKDGTA